MQQLTSIEPGVVEWHDVPAPGLQADDDALVRPVAVVLVVGGGGAWSIGLGAIDIALPRGAGTVTYVDDDDAGWLAVAETLGADLVATEAPDLLAEPPTKASIVR